jgi:hypothetical protein
MGKILDIANKMRGLTEASINKTILKSFKENQEAATNLNTDQLFQGQETSGALLPPYSKRSVEVFGKPAGPIRLFETGDFYRGFFVKADKFPVVFSSKDNKTEKLTKAFGQNEIFGLNKTNLSDFSKSYVLPDLQEFVRSFLHV